MNLKKITLNNIRSYLHQEVEFPTGSTLLSGDIGSGKTSVLLGIEFALFGLQPGQRGTSLLRNGLDSGGVILEFEVDKKIIIVERTLKRAKSISQDYCSISIDGVKEEISVMELKSRILNLLNYPSEFSKKQNLLYKFTVYTPQEEMKQIILQDAKTRINTLRHVFGIDKYKKILENISIITLKLREEQRIKRALTENIEQDKLDIVSKENELEAKHYNLQSVEKELFLKKEERKKIQEEKEEISGKIEEKKRFQQEVEKTKIMISNKNETTLNNKKSIEQLEAQLEELQDLRFEDSEIIELERKIARGKIESQDLDEKNLNLTTQINSLGIKNKDNQDLKEKIGHIDLCPTCLQDVDPVYKSNVLNKLDSDTIKNVREIENLNLEKRELIIEINKLRTSISVNEENVQKLKVLKVRFQTVVEKREKVEEIKNSNIVLEKDITLLEKHIESLRGVVFELSKFDNVFETKQRQLEEGIRQERMADIKVAELKKEIEVFTIQIEELKVKVEKIEVYKTQLDFLTRLETWLTKKFSPVISFIERNVMVKLKAEFSQLFSEWFSILVSDSFNVRLDDDFTPVIEQQDYAIDYAYLSGGERTAIALAYRLSLNQVINSMLSKIKTKDLVILDEPTDGFSEQQLDKMRDVLQELNVSQLIIVSHEQKMEDYVENVIKFKKENNTSKKAE